MSTYASKQDVENYIEGWVTDDVFALERLIQRAERDIDLIMIRRHAEQPPTQVISIIGATGGTWTLRWTDYNGTVNSVVFPYNTDAATIQAAIQAFSAVGVDSTTGIPNIAVLGTNPFTLVWTWQWGQTHYVGRAAPSLDWQIPLVTVDTSTLTPVGTASAAVVQVAGRKINPLTDVDQNQVVALSNAACAQVEYRNAMGPAFFVKPQYRSVKGPDFTTEGKLPYVAPKARLELSQVGLIQTLGRAVAGQGRRGVGKGWATY